MTSVEGNKELARRFYDEVVAKGRVGLLDSLATPDIFDHSAERMGWSSGRAGFVQHVEWLHGAVSDIDVTVDDLIAEGDRVVVYWTLAGTHSGEFFGVPATGRSFEASAVSLLTFTDGQVSEYLVRPDGLGLLQQLGALP